LQKLFASKDDKDKNQANGNAAAGSEMQDGNASYDDSVWDAEPVIAYTQHGSR
jgi:hypothetical protein